MYDVILMDFSVPHQNSIEAIKVIRDFLQSEISSASERTAPLLLRQPYICCMTSYKSQRSEENGVSIGINSFINKPVFKEDMHRLLGDAVEHFRATMANDSK